MIDVLTMVLLGIFFLAILIGLYFFIETTILYPHEFILKLSTSGTPIVIRTRAREIKGATSNPEWKLLYKKLRVPVPDAKVRSITKKGKFYVEAWLFSDGQIQFENNQLLDVKYESIPNAVPSEMLTTEQRIMLTHQFKKAELERGKSIKDFLMQIAMPLGMALILGIVIIFGMVQWGDLNGPGLQFADKMVQLEQSRLEQVKILEAISNDVQIIKAREGLSNITAPSNIEAPN